MCLMWHYVYGSSETWLAASRDRAIVADCAICINGFSGPDFRKPREFYSINGTLALLVAENFLTRLHSVLYVIAWARLDFLTPSGQTPKEKKEKEREEGFFPSKGNKEASATSWRPGFAKRTDRKSKDINLITITPRRLPYLFPTVR